MESDIEKKVEEELKGIAKIISRFIEVYQFTMKYWYILGIVCGFVWGTAKLYYKAYAEPEIKVFIVKTAKDSLAPLVPPLIQEQLDTILSHKGVPFKFQLSQLTNIPIDSVAPNYARLLISYYEQQSEVDSLRRYIAYNNGIIRLIIAEMFQKYRASNGAIIWYAPSGDPYYFDEYGFLWSANPKADGNFYYYPPYLSNQMQKCVPLL